MANDFSGKTVLITGAARGLGLAIAREFFGRGARVAINDLDADHVSNAIASLGGGDRLGSAVADVATVTGCDRAVAEALDQFGQLDILINNAGINIERPVQEWDETHWDAHVNVILKGAFFCSKAALPALRANKGNIVNISSNLGIHAVRDNVGYCAAKGGLLNLTRALALDVAPEVRVNCLCPGVMDTELMRLCAEDSGDAKAYYQSYIDYAPLRRISEPAEIAKSVAFLASEDAAFLTGSVLSADGGGTAGWSPINPVRA